MKFRNPWIDPRVADVPTGGGAGISGTTRLERGGTGGKSELAALRNDRHRRPDVVPAAANGQWRGAAMDDRTNRHIGDLAGTFRRRVAVRHSLPRQRQRIQWSRGEAPAAHAG